tara:strand:- start:595 stop:1335 length:741 start_codon:yes stop_codon:yes gene_type:complete
MSKYLETMPESLEDKIKKIFGETVAKEGNKFTKALMAARDNGKKFFSVNGREYKTEDYVKENLMRKGMADMQAQKKHKAKKEDNSNDKSDDGEGMDKVQPKAVKKKFADRKDKDIDNDGDVDSSDKFLHKRRKAISKAVNKEETQEDIAKEVVETIAKKNMSMREALAKVWDNGYDKLQNNNPFEGFGANTPTSNQGVATVKRDQAAPKMGNASGPNRSNPNKKPVNASKTETGKPVTKVEVNPKA